jgi:SanA protein
MMKSLGKLFSHSWLLPPLAILVALAWWKLLPWWYRGEMLTPATAAPQPVAIVFGARVYSSGRLSSMLRDRVESAVQLYQQGQVQKIIMSGDNQVADYNEPDAMIAYALARGVPSEALQPDYGGRRTYDTCYRAREVFQLESAVLVTQAFHLPRALFTCEQLGLDVTGVIADRRLYSRRSLTWSQMREIPATLVALVDVVLQRPAPVLGEPLPLELSPGGISQ